MSATNQFVGLPMPVFTAFGWAGEETAIKFALEQLEQFIQQLHAELSPDAKDLFPYAGMNHETKSVYLAADSEADENLFVSFFARPMSLELQLAIIDPKVLAGGYKIATAQPTLAHRLITELGPDWSLRVHQIQVDEESGEQANYQDLFKDSVTKLDPDDAKELFEKTAYLNGQDKWTIPFYLSRRFQSEQIAAMNIAVVQVINDQINEMLPLLHFLTGKKKSSARTRSTGKKKAVKGASTVKETAVSEATVLEEAGFTYVSEVKPLALRKGFVNMTSHHWPFFAINSRTETRPVTVYYDGIYDKASSVWRLQPNNVARLMLSPQVHQWYEDNFEANDHIQLSVAKLDDEEIQISLKHAE